MVHVYPAPKTVFTGARYKDGADGDHGRVVPSLNAHVNVHVSSSKDCDAINADHAIG
jgi:hypothetical protein